MSKLLNRSLNRILIYAGLVLTGSIPVYYFIISRLWQYELDEHEIILTHEAGREDSFLIIMVVTLLTTLFFVLLITGLILMNRRISKKLWKPFYQSLEQIRNFSLDKQGKIMFEPTDIDEFAELNQSLHKLIGENIAAYNQQKEFTDNASHELQTPLSIVQSKLDLLLQSKSLTDEQYDIIEDANKALARVARINKNLLLLAKIENSQFMDKETIDVSELLQNTLTTLSVFVDSKQLTIQSDILPHIQIDGNKILVGIVLNNLLTNAIRYTPSEGQITINLSQNVLTIANTGSLALNQDKMFKRFGTTSAETPGTGLGLALVKQICNRYSWEVTYSFDFCQHIFSIRF